MVVRLPCAPAECEFVLAGKCQDSDGLEPGRCWDTAAGDYAMRCKNRYSTCRTVSDGTVTDGVCPSVPRRHAALKPGASGAPLCGFGA